jgi:hypothetical protein
MGIPRWIAVSDIDNETIASCVMKLDNAMDQGRDRTMTGDESFARLLFRL